MSETVLTVEPWLEIPCSEFEFTFSRSSGPGGQNVNKVNSKVLLRWPVRGSPSLPLPIRERFVKKYAARITAEGDLLIVSQRSRDQAKNREDCLARLSAMLTSVVQPPKPRKKTKPSKGAVRRRLEQKKRVAGKKRQRGGLGDE